MRAYQAWSGIRVGDSSLDAELIARVLHGEREAYSVLVRRYQQRIYGYARGMGIDHDTALDLTQDAFVRGYVKLRRCRKRECFGAWIFRILRNRCLDHLKSAARRGVSLEVIADSACAHDTEEEVRVTLDEALTALPVALREAFLLKHRDGWSYEELAEITGATVSAVKMRVHRAREALREMLEVTVTA